MYLCYADESGYNGAHLNPQQPVQAMAAILPNAYNYHRSDAEFEEIFDIIKEKVPVRELKCEQIYRGRDRWGKLRPDLRDQVIDFYIRWIQNRNHKFIVTAVDNERYFTLVAEGTEEKYQSILSILPCPYLFSGLHIALAIQKLNRIKPKNKGKTLLIFDEQDEFSDRLSDVIFSPPTFVDDFVPFDQKQEHSRLNQIIDTAFFVRSHQSSMAQVVDFVAFVLRLHLELQAYGAKEAYPGEKAKVARWAASIKEKCVPLATLYPQITGGKPFLELLLAVRAAGLR